MSIQLFLGDCLEVLPTLPSGSVHAFITDLPYGTTTYKWDSVIPLAPMWEQVKRLLIKRGVFVTTASQPFTSTLITSNLKWFRYCWVWDKKLSTGNLDAKRKPLKRHEDICVFSAGRTVYNPQMVTRGKPRWKGGDGFHATGETMYHDFQHTKTFNNTYYPTTIIEVSNAARKQKHPSEKPLALYEYLVSTYTNPGDVVVDLCMGSGTTGEACQNLARDFIGIEKNPYYFDIARDRLGVENERVA